MLAKLIIILLIAASVQSASANRSKRRCRCSGRYGREVMPEIQEAEALEAEALESEEPTSEHEVTEKRDKRQLPFPMGMGAGLGVPPIGGLGVPPMIAPVGGLGITGSPIIDLLVLGSLFGGNNNGGYHRRRHHDKRAVEELLQEAEPLEMEDPTSAQLVEESIKTGDRVKRQLIGGGLLSPLSPMGSDPILSLFLLSGLYGNGGPFSSSPMGGRHRGRN